MKCHKLDHQILGDDLQMVEVELDPGETVIAEAGAMCYMEDGIEFQARMGDGSQPQQGFLDKLWSGAKRMMAGDSLFITHFTNHGSARAKVAFGAPYPGKVIPVELGQHEGELLCQKSAFLCAALGTQLDIAFQKRFGAGLLGGEGFILQRVRGDGLVCLHAGGHVVRRDLENSVLRVDTGCIVAFEGRIDYDIEMVKGMMNMLAGGEGVVLATLRGTGTVWLQSLPLNRLADRIVASSRLAGHAGSSEEGSVLGSIGRQLMGGQ